MQCKTFFFFCISVFRWDVQRIGSYWCHSDVGIDVTLKSFTTKLFYVMSKPRSGELSSTWTCHVIS